MLLGIKSWKDVFIRHLIVGLISLVLVNLMFISRSEMPFEVRVWRAFGNISFILLVFSLVIGPLGKIFPKCQKIIPWRRETGIWFFLLALFHLIRVFNYSQLEPGNELAGFLGYIGLFWGFLLAATSSDKAVNFLGIDSWKWLHNMSYVIFYVVVGHISYFLFWSFGGKNIFTYPFLIMAISVPVIQIIAFLKIVISKNKQKGKTEIRSFETTVKKIEEVAENTIEVTFDRPVGFKFIAGQYIQISVDKLIESDFKGKYRLFSISSSNADNNEFSVAYRDSDSGFKKTLKKLASDSKVTIEGPFGDFVLPQNSKNKSEDQNEYVFIAGGIGITPFMSMLRSLKDNNSKKKITLLYGNSNKQSAAYIEELQEMAKEDLISLVETYERINTVFIQSQIQDLNSKKWLVVGPPEMVSNVKNILIDLKIDTNRIMIESFDGYSD